MKRNEGTPIKRGLPQGAEAADKSGELDGLRCDRDRRGPGRGHPAAFVISVMTAYLKDDAAGRGVHQRRDAGGVRLLRRAGALDRARRKWIEESPEPQRERGPIISGSR